VSAPDWASSLPDADDLDPDTDDVAVEAEKRRYRTMRTKDGDDSQVSPEPPHGAPE
jgi:hypothetical protein